MFNMNDLVDDLKKVDKHLGLTDGTTANVIAYHRAEFLDELNRELIHYGVFVNADCVIAREQRPAWAALLKLLDVSRAWWMCGDPSVTDLPGEIDKI